MNYKNQDVIRVSTNIVQVMAVITGALAILILLSGDILAALIMGVLLWLDLWVFFKLLHSYERVLDDVEMHTMQIEKLKKQIRTLEDRLR